MINSYATNKIAGTYDMYLTNTADENRTIHVKGNFSANVVAYIYPATTSGQ